MKTLKMKSLKSILFFIILVWGLSAFLGYMAVPSLYTHFFTEPVYWDDVDFDGEIEGLYVNGWLYGVYDWYCEEVENNDTISREYLIDADDYYYIAMRAEGEDMAAADALMEISQAFLNEEVGETELGQAQYEITGVIKKIPSDSLEFYYDYLDWYSMDTESQAMFLPYYIDVNNLGRYDIGEATVMTVVAIGCFLVGLIFLLLALTGRYQKHVKKYIANSANPDMTREKIEHFIQNTPEVNGLRYNRDFICGHQGGTTAFGELPKLAWVYLHTVSHKRYFITISKSYSLMLCFADGSVQQAGMKNEAVALGHMEKLSQICPQTIFGYTDELQKMYRNDLNGFLNLRYNQVQANNIGFDM